MYLYSIRNKFGWKILRGGPYQEDEYRLESVSKGLPLP